MKPGRWVTLLATAGLVSGCGFFDFTPIDRKHPDDPGAGSYYCPECPPAQVTGLTATPGDGRITLSWTNPTDIDFARVRVVYREDSFPGGHDDGTEAYSGLLTSFTHEGLEDGVVYYYMVYACDHASNYSAGSAVAAATAGVSVLLVRPADGSTQVGVNTTVTLGFSKPMNTATVESAFSLAGAQPVAGSYAWSSADTMLTFTISVSLAAGQVHTIWISTIAADKNGSTLRAVFSSSFTTSTALDITAPTVVSAFPANGAVDVPINTTVTVTFSQPMDGPAVESAFSLSGGQAVAGSFAWSSGDTVLTFTPAAALAPSQVHAVSVSTAATDMSGNGLGSAFSSTFATGVVVDTTPPAVSSVSPANGVTDVPVGTTIAVTFSEPMDTAATQNAFSLTGVQAVPGSFAWSLGDTVLTFTPSAGLVQTQPHTISLSTGAMDKSGNSLASSFSSSFTTAVQYAMKWQFATATTGAMGQGHPALGADGTVYVGSADGNVYAVNPDGTQKWVFDTGAESTDPPTIAVGDDGTVYVGPNYVDASGTVCALNPDGTVKWAYSTNSVSNASYPAVDSDGTMYIGLWDGRLLALRADGTKKWEYVIGATVDSSPSIGADGTVYIGCRNSNLYAFNPDGTQKWAVTLSGQMGNWSGPAIAADGTVYMNSGYGDSKMYAVRADGTLKWQFVTGGRTDGTPTIGPDGTVYLSSGDGKLYAINPDGSKKWEFAAEGQVYCAAAIGADGMLYVGSIEGGKFYVLDSLGTKQWEYAIGQAVTSSAAIASDGTVYTGSYYGGRLYAFRSPSLGLASSQWPRFRHDNKSSGRR